MSSYKRLPVLLAGAIVGALSASAASSTAPTAALQTCAAGLNGQIPTPTPPDFKFSGNVRQYYIAAEEVEWDYAPTGWDNWMGVPMNVSTRANMASANQYGTKWLKALYRGYTDSSFTTYSEQPPWQGTQGPTIRSEVGDLIEIMFLNKLSVNYATMHSMGLEYTKTNGEGADYPNNTMPGVNVVLPESGAVPPIGLNGVGPGGCVVYKWMVNAAAGPPAGEPAMVHSYRSYVDLQTDSNAGLIGPQIVYAQGQMASTMANYREIPLLYMIYSESNSWLSAENKAVLGAGGNSRREAQGGPGGQHGQNQGNGNPNPQNQGNGNPNNQNGYQHPSQGSGSGNATSSGPSSTSSVGSPTQSASTGAASSSAVNVNNLWPGNYTVWHPQAVNLAGSGQFSNAPSFYTMNGYIFGNNPTYEMCLSDKVIWYVNAYGGASHVFHMHGNGFKYHGFNEYAMSVNDGVGKTLYMDAVGGGKWQVICHVDNHQALGMVSDYQVYPAGQCPLPALG
ncbi:hypothetical protein LTS02_009782 [Friedmanniomyces endolithicus]|nr:hypothetical protein LTR94_001269 [Friedmanniomyces endolithicus]KAK0780643.1 hypothetical protein LTR59_012776 [Friedmanniomyces endolithicus]KAK0811662.1 hypothetical protein LTR38_003586 [Friedmanniomyces endolithicus]KAK0853960.1 hypothetical protein LTR03_002588 [Friedmanniomyces endolithicus]KAK0858518.1 hypothetical protein LTS02_009782 [Friedmanniomyces endolithicus]